MACSLACFGVFDLATLLRQKLTKTKRSDKKVEAVQFEFECRFEAEVVKGDLHHHQVIPTDPIHSPGRQKASRRYTQYLDITCLLINLKAVHFYYKNI